MAMNPFTILILYSLAMITVPISIYFLLKNSLESFISKQSASIYSIVGSVLTIHVILFGFIYQAFNEDKKVSKAPEKTE